MPGDDTGDNISRLNPHFCELTAHYWYWKNRRPAARWVGLNHYRRYFAFNRPYRYGIHPEVYIPESMIASHEPAIPSMDEYMRGYDILLAAPTHNHIPMEWAYAIGQSSEDFDALSQVIADLSPDYSEAFDHVLRHGNRLSHYNMFVMPAERFDHYSQWLFSILFEVQRRVTISKDPRRARIFGYMAEHLLNVYTHRHNLRVKHAPVLMVSDTPNRSYLRSLLSTLRVDLISSIILHDNPY